MQLPDEAFGRRWVIGQSAPVASDGCSYRLSNCSLPEWTVLWGLYLNATDPTGNTGYIEYRLGDSLPANLTEFRQLAPVFQTVLDHNNIESSFRVGLVSNLPLILYRLPIHTMGRRVVFGFCDAQAGSFIVSTYLVVSSIPTEVPEWMISEEVKDRRL